jgi:hypothetical protein
MKVLAVYFSCLMYSKIYLRLEPLGLEHDVFKSKDPRKIARFTETLRRTEQAA